MRYGTACLVGVMAFLSAGHSIRAEVKTVIERNEGENATAEFKFKNLPTPARNDAAARARFSILSGDVDGHSGDVEQLNDGNCPDEADQPDANFFFDTGTEGGRLAVDLGDAIEIKQVNTYSWHPDLRGPQVYKLYAADGRADGFNARPGRGAEPEKSGWKLIAAIDSRPQSGPPGGQYGVSISDSNGPLGTYRYLLFDIEATERSSPSGNTFYSEIDVVGTSTSGTRRQGARAPVAERKYEIEIDYAEMPELKDWVETKLRPTLERWYPIIVDSLPSEGYVAPRRLSVTFRKDKRGVADTGGTRINCAGKWFKENLEGEAVGAVVHELVHVAQRYGRVRGGNQNPGWLVEGVADYLRWFKFEPASARPRPNPARAKYTDSYRTTAAFLEYLATTKDHEIVVKLNAAMREGRYTPELWKEYTGQTVDELWSDYLAHLRAAK